MSVSRRPAESSIRALGFGLFLTTLSVLLLELSLTRLFSVVLFYHYAFLAISLAVLGLASGGVMARLLPETLDPEEHHRLMAGACIGAALSLVPALRFTLDTNVWLVTTWETGARIALLFLLFLVPFALAGFVIASTMVIGSRRIATLYFFDLLGGSFGCLLFVPLMGALGGPSAVLCVGLLWAVTGFVWSLRSGMLRLVAGSLGVSLLMLTLLALNRDGDLFDVRYTRGRPVGEEVFAAWNSFSRVSVERDESGADQLWILIDGGAGTWLSDIDLDGSAGDDLRERLGGTGPELAFWLRQPGTSLVIGPGGGIDVARALAAASADVAAVEINPIIANDIMRGRFAGHSHGLYERPEVRVVVEDGRSYVRRTGERFDVVQLSQVDTWASSAAGSYTLTEGYLYTVEAFEDYIDRLTDGGLVSVSRWEFQRPRESLRLAAVAQRALERHGVERPADHIVVVMEDVDAEGLMRMGTVIVSDRPFTEAELEAVRRRVAETPMSLAYAPGPADAGEGDPVFRELMLTSDRDRFFADYDFDVTPVTDDSPFFFFTGRWRNTFRDLFTFDPSGDSVNTGAQFLLVMLLALASLAVALFIFGPLLLAQHRLPEQRGVYPYLAYCVAVGLGYILIEISLIHRFMVFLGQPVYSLTVVIFLFLLSSSLGSRVTQGFPALALASRARWAVLAIVGLLSLYALVVPWLTREFQYGSVALKMAVVTAVVFPLGFLMGIPFASALRLAVETRHRIIEWIWAVNAAATVMGSILAIFVFVVLGIRAGLVLGALCYAACVVLLPTMGRLATGEYPAVRPAAPPFSPTS